MSKKVNMKKCVGGVVLSLVMTTAMGMSAMADEIPTIRFAHQDTASSEGMQVIVDTLDDYIASVADKYIVEQEVVAGDDLKTKIATDMASDNLPDIMWYWQQLMQEI